MPARTTLIGVTATLCAGNETEPLMDILGLKPGSFFFSRRSNRRPELQLLVRKLRHGLQGHSFPDLRWVIEGHRKTIIYCSTISLAFRVFVYLWHSSTPSDPSIRRMGISVYSDGVNGIRERVASSSEFDTPVAVFGGLYSPSMGS